jgi:hypothetical protein
MEALLEACAGSKPDEFASWDLLVGSLDSLSAFSLLLEPKALPQASVSHLFRQFTWEVLDKVCDLGVSLTSDGPTDTLNGVIYLIARNSRPRELFMMIVEKLMTVEPLAESITLACVLLRAVQTAVVSMGHDHLSSGLSLALKTIVKRFSASLKLSSFAPILAMTLDFYDGLCTNLGIPPNQEV